MRGSHWFAIVLTAMSLGLILPCAAHAEEEGPTAGLKPGEPQPETSPSTVPNAPRTIDRGDNAWMLTSSALVLMMTGPGLAMFYGGLVRKKNVLSVIMQCIFLTAMMAVIWSLWGYALSFGGTFDGWLGGKLGEGLPNFYFLKDAEAHWTASGPEIPLHASYNVPILTHMLFQGMFFIITPALICGAFAERMKFSTMVVFMLLWGTLVYCPLCHWVWGGGILAYGSPFAKTICLGGALDFAGGTVVHISSGISALICALLLGKRLNYGNEPMPPHNLTYTALGAALLWVGWFGFNAGSALAADGVAASAFAATHFSAAAGALMWAGLEWRGHGKPTVLGACSGAVAGLVCITPASGYVKPMAALAMGAAGGLVCYLACTKLKSKFKYDDSLDAFGVHGVGGTLGAILTGVFATRDIGAYLEDGKAVERPLGLLEGGSLLSGQIVAVLITWVFAAVVTFVLLKVLDAVMGLRVSTQDELQGLDLTQHGEEGYIFI